MHCPKCAIDLNDDLPQCPKCGFHIDELDPVFGPPPARTDAVTDLAKVVGEAGMQQLKDRLKAFTERTGAALFIVTVPTTAPRLPSEYVFWLFNRWQVGGENHVGLLVLLAMQERRIEVEVGIDLERFVSDEAASVILQAHAVPFLRKGDVDGGLFHAVDVLARVVEDGIAQEKTA